MSGKLHLICMKTEGFHAKIRCNLNDISYLSETQKNNFQFLNELILCHINIGQHMRLWYLKHMCKILLRTLTDISNEFRDLNEPRHEIPNNVAGATSKGSYKPVHMRSLTRAFC